MLALHLMSAVVDALLGLWERACLFIGLDTSKTFHNQTDTIVTLAYGALVITDPWTREIKRLEPGAKLERITVFGFSSGPRLLMRHHIEAHDLDGTLVFCREFNDVTFRLIRQIVITRRVAASPANNQAPLPQRRWAEGNEPRRLLHRRPTAALVLAITRDLAASRAKREAPRAGRSPRPTRP